jgi:hypothetical protein
MARPPLPRWVIVEWAGDGQIVGAWGPYTSHKRAMAAWSRLRDAIGADDMATETDAQVVPLFGHREMLRQIEVMF